MHVTMAKRQFDNKTWTSDESAGMFVSRCFNLSTPKIVCTSFSQLDEGWVEDCDQRSWILCSLQPTALCPSRALTADCLFILSPEKVHFCLSVRTRSAAKNRYAASALHDQPYSPGASAVVEVTGLETTIIQHIIHMYQLSCRMMYHDVS